MTSDSCSKLYRSDSNQDFLPPGTIRTQHYVRFGRFTEHSIYKTESREIDEVSTRIPKL